MLLTCLFDVVFNLTEKRKCIVEHDNFEKNDFVYR